MQDYYDINVSLNGYHFFATHPRSVTYRDELKVVYPIIKAKFPESEGFKVTVTLWQGRGYGVDLETLEVSK